MSEEAEGEVEWYIELAESIPVPVYIVLVRTTGFARRITSCTLSFLSSVLSAQRSGTGTATTSAPDLMACVYAGQFLLPIIWTTVVARYVGNYFNDGLYEMAQHVKNFPFLEHAYGAGPRSHLRMRTVDDVMVKEVRTTKC